jgi:hypothetical protein
MLESPLTFYKPDVRFEGEQGNLSKTARIAVFDETAIFHIAFNAMPQIPMKIEIQKACRLNFGNMLNLAMPFRNQRSCLACL